ncbi:MAG: hypothetical protein AAFV95_06160 [Bacteroidota bacterium]
MNKNLRNRFDRLNSESDQPDLSWEAMGPKINAQLKQEEDRPKWGFFWRTGIVVALLLGVLLGWYWMAPSGSNEMTTPADVTALSSDNNGRGLQEERTSSSVYPTVSEAEKKNASTSQRTTAASASTSGEKAAMAQQKIQTKKNKSMLKGAPSTAQNSFFSDESTDDPIALDQQVEHSSANQQVSTNRPINFQSPQVPMRPFTAMAGPAEHALPSTPSAPTSLIRSKQSTWQIDVGAGLLQSNIQDAFSLANAELGHAIHLQLSHRFHNRWFVSSGLQLNRHRFVSENSSQDTVPFYQPSTITTVFVSNNNVEGYAYTDTISAVRLRQFQHHNSVDVYRIPILLGHQWQKGRWSATATAGTHFNIVNVGRGRVIDQAYQISEVKSGLSINSLGLQGQLNIGYQLTNQLLVSGRIGYSMDRLTTPLTDGSQSLRSMQTGLGIGWLF